MKAPNFRYHRPVTIAEAVALLRTHDNARVLAGGQSLMPMMNLRVSSPDDLIDLGGIAELVGIADTGEDLVIGAMTTQRAIERSALVASAAPLLAETVAHVGHQRVRRAFRVVGKVEGGRRRAERSAERLRTAALCLARLQRRSVQDPSPLWPQYLPPAVVQRILSFFDV